MCGCMLMHAVMDHSGHQQGDQPAPQAHAVAMAGPGAGRCGHCSFVLQPDFTFCPNCGMSLRTSECPACGRKVDGGWSACAYCGSPLGNGGKAVA